MLRVLSPRARDHRRPPPHTPNHLVSGCRKQYINNTRPSTKFDESATLAAAGIRLKVTHCRRHLTTWSTALLVALRRHQSTTYCCNLRTFRHAARALLGSRSLKMSCQAKIAPAALNRCVKVFPCDQRAARTWEMYSEMPAVTERVSNPRLQRSEVFLARSVHLKLVFDSCWQVCLRRLCFSPHRHVS